MSEHSENARRSFGRHTSASKQAEADQIASTKTLAQAGMTTDEHGANSELKKKARQSTDRGFGKYLPQSPGGSR